VIELKLFRSLVFAVTAALALFASTYAQSPGVQPNILWITCEDISPNLGCYGDSLARTPHLDQLAQEGILYRHAYGSAPVCAVARSSIISGVYASSLGSQHMRCAASLPSAVQLYPELLRESGYYCTNNAKTDYNLDIDHKAIWDDCSTQAHWRNRPTSDQPFFSIFNLKTSHESRVNDSINYRNAIASTPEAMLRKPGEIPVPAYFPNSDVVQELWARYYNIITAMDREVGDILLQLEEDGLAQNTIVFFYSDHGAGVPRHKRWLFDTGLQVPLIVHLPEAYENLSSSVAGSVSEELVSFLDLPATALELAGVPLPSHLEGQPFLSRNPITPRDYIFAGRDRMDERYDMQRAVRDKQYKYIRYYQPYLPYCQYMNTPEKGGIMQAIRGAEMSGKMPPAGAHIIAKSKPVEALYDCERDPLELVNLASDPLYTEKLKELRKAHADWSDQTMDTGLIPETIIREWEVKYEKPIYQIMREQQIPVAEIREAALDDLSVSQLLDRMNHENAAVRYWAAIQLGNKADLTSQAPIEPALLEDAVPVVRFAVARAVILQGNTTLGLPVLQRGLKHGDEWVRLHAALNLDELGDTARASLPDLQSVMTDENKYVVRVANHAINLLTGSTNVVK